jgi:imidazolonepropionase-like amidohydrolase
MLQEECAMKNLLCVLVLAGLPALLSAQTNDSVLVIRGGTLVDVRSGNEIPDSVIVVRGERIEQVGTAGKITAPTSVKTIDARGKWIVPGLIDSHAHAGTDERVSLGLYLAKGVTTIRNPGGNITQLRLLREQLLLTVVGPRLFFSGPLLDGLPPVFPAGSLLVDTPKRARSAVNFLADQGVDFVKVYNNVKEPELKVIVQTAKERGLPVAGHVPRTLTMTRAIELGMTRLEHIRITGNEMLSPEEAAAIDPLPVGRREPMLWQRFNLQSEKMQALVRRLADSRVFLDPTLVTDEFFGASAETEGKDPNNQYFPKSFVEEQLKGWNTGLDETPPELRQAALEAFQKEEKFVGMCSAAGVRIIAGTDGPEIGELAPGFGLHRELELLVASGLTPLQALRAATSTAAEALAKEDQLGTVEQGKLADLVILDADPLSSVLNLARIHLVLQGGKSYEPSTLLDQARAQASKKP